MTACLSCTGSAGWPRRGPNPSRLSWSLQGQNLASRRRRAAPKPIFWELAGPGPGPGGLQLLLLHAAITPCAEASENGEKNPLATSSRLWPRPPASFFITRTHAVLLMRVCPYVGCRETETPGLAPLGSPRPTLLLPGLKPEPAAQHHSQAALGASGDGSSAACARAHPGSDRQIGKKNKNTKNSSGTGCVLTRSRCFSFPRWALRPYFKFGGWGCARMAVWGAGEE